LPRYSPDYNPIESLWRAVKANTHNSYIATFEALMARVEARLRELGGDRGQVQRLLGTPLDDYAARPRATA
jgi:transposase